MVVERKRGFSAEVPQKTSEGVGLRAAGLLRTFAQAAKLKGDWYSTLAQSELG